MTFGDVLAIALVVVVSVVTLWAGIAAFAVLFSARARAAARGLCDAPGRQIAVGAGFALAAGIVSVILMTKGGPVSIVGFALLAAALSVGVLGSAGLALVVGDRLRAQDAALSPLGATLRGAALCVAAGLIPVIGWFFVMPVALLASLGAGVSVLFAKPRSAPESARVQAPPVALPAEA